MKKLILIFSFVILSVNLTWAVIDPVKFIVVRMDYQSYATKYLYYFTQPYDIVLPDSSETVCHDLYVHIIPAGDFGETSIRSRTTGQLVYKATTIWMGTGEHIFPPSAKQTNPSDSEKNAVLKFIDFEKYWFTQGDEARADTAWQNAVDIAPLTLFGDSEYGILTYLHYFSVGVSNPATAEWVIVFYSIADEIPPGKWVNIGRDLPDQHINDVHNNFAFEEIVYAATRNGLFKTTDEGDSWRLEEFSNNAKVNVTVFEATPNPWVDCLCEYLYLGTEEYSMIPEERRGRIFRSQLDGDIWEDTKFPDIAVTAIGINPLNPHTVYASAFNPFYHTWGLYKLADSSGWKKIMPQPFESRVIRFNCIAVCPVDTNLVLSGTDQGLIISRDNAFTWEHHLNYFNISSIQFFQDQIFVSTNCKPESRSDGIYVSYDLGKNWEVWTWWVHCVDMVTGFRTEKNKPAYFFLGDSGTGVFGTREARYSWQNISWELPEKQITCLTCNLKNPASIIAGTVNGLYKYKQIFTGVQFPEVEKTPLPKSMKLLRNYPNPFNASTNIRYVVNENSSAVKLIIYNSLGQQVKILVNENKSPGEYLVEWDGRNEMAGNMPSGIYFCRIELNGMNVDWIKMILLR